MDYFDFVFWSASAWLRISNFNSFCADELTLAGLMFLTRSEGWNGIFAQWDP
jgi:hypothetical protein